MRSPYLLFKRKSAKNKPSMWYVRVWIPGTDKYETAKSVGMIADKLKFDRRQWPPTQKPAAKIIVDHWLNLRNEKSADDKDNPPLSEYCASFWDYNSSQYIKSKILRGKTISEFYCKDRKRKIEKYVEPRTVGLSLQNVTARELDALQIRLRAELPGLSAKTINDILAGVCTPIREAYRLGVIPKNPAFQFLGIQERPKKRGILTADEVRRLFASEWELEAYRLIFWTGICTGMRLGEICALKASDIGKDGNGLPVIRVVKSWSFIQGREKSTKTGNDRTVPINAALRDALAEWAARNPYGDGFIFWSEIQEGRPLSAKVIERNFVRQLERIGIDKKQRKDRNIVFHGLRHYYNSALRGTIDDSLLQMATGHLSTEMTNNYDHETAEKMDVIRRAVDEKIGILGL